MVIFLFSSFPSDNFSLKIELATLFVGKATGNIFLTVSFKMAGGSVFVRGTVI